MAIIFERGKKYVFDIKSFEEQSGATEKYINYAGWPLEVHGKEVKVYDDLNGSIGMYWISPEWCMEVK